MCAAIVTRTSALVCKIGGTEVFDTLSATGIVRKNEDKKANRLYAFGELIDIMDEGTQPL